MADAVFGITKQKVREFSWNFVKKKKKELITLVAGRWLIPISFPPFKFHNIIYI